MPATCPFQELSEAVDLRVSALQQVILQSPDPIAHTASAAIGMERMVKHAAKKWRDILIAEQLLNGSTAPDAQYQTELYIRQIIWGAVNESDRPKQD